MKKAFTIIELVIVMVAGAIIAMVLVPRFADSRLREAADQIVSHIRYTQHLAMIDDKFNPTDSQWYKMRWQISFRRCEDNNGWYYVVGYDSNKNDGVDKAGSAINPADGRRMFVSNTCTLQEDESSEILISDKYQIENIEFSDSCGDNQYIAFDNIGRPYASTLGVSPYDVMTGRCDITFLSSDGDFTISIESETGYVHMTAIND
ncbi:putative periplasmic ATP /GTP-binding protein [Hydrogenimonas sp.]|nr:putative periplasmic ATP /GTP-binding protein [Hydrogenimonas sp.]